MQVLVAVTRGVFAFALSFMVIDDSRANPVEVEADAGVITMIATVEAIDVTNRVVTLVGPNNNWVEVIVGPDKIKVIKLKEKITVSYQDEVAVALRTVNKGQQGDSFAADETADMGLDAPTVAEQDWVTVTPHGRHRPHHGRSHRHHRGAQSQPGHHHLRRNRRQDPDLPGRTERQSQRGRGRRRGRARSDPRGGGRHQTGLARDRLPGSELLLTRDVHSSAARGVHDHGTEIFQIRFEGCRARGP